MGKERLALLQQGGRQIGAAAGAPVVSRTTAGTRQAAALAVRLMTQLRTVAMAAAAQAGLLRKLPGVVLLLAAALRLVQPGSWAVWGV